RILGIWRKSWGTYQNPRFHTVECTSLLVEASYQLPKIQGLSIKAEFAADHGQLYGNNTAGAITLSYRGNLTF
ncbi:MAG: hypothetical protein ACI4SO_01190, partial [Muribaculaceae bacterium]